MGLAALLNAIEASAQMSALLIFRQLALAPDGMEIEAMPVDDLFARCDETARAHSSESHI